MSIGLKSYKLAKRIRDKLVMGWLRGGFLHFGKGSILMLPFRSGNEHRIFIGHNVFVGPGAWIQVVSDDCPGSDPVIQLEDDVSISGDCTITAVSRVTICKGALIARFVHISDHSHGTGKPLIPIKEQPLSNIAPVTIGEGAWLGHGVVICPGVTIGRNAVIGANSVVRHDIPDGCVAVGAPARIVRRPTLSATSPSF
jgi:acetyltransferase-like isoleucine patch superfamily enzyme